MSRQINKNIITEQVKNVSATESIQRFYVNKDGNIIVEIVAVLNEESGIESGTESSEISKTYWKIPSSILASIQTTGDTFYNDIKTALWNKIIEIEGLSEGEQANYKLNIENIPPIGAQPSRIFNILDKY